MLLDKRSFWSEEEMGKVSAAQPPFELHSQGRSVDTGRVSVEDGPSVAKLSAEQVNSLANGARATAYKLRFRRGFFEENWQAPQLRETKCGPVRPNSSEDV